MAVVGESAEQGTADQSETENADRARSGRRHLISVAHADRTDLGECAKAATVASMAAAGTNDSDPDIEGYAVAVVREDAGWKVTPLNSSALDSLEDAELQLRELRAAGAVFGLLNVDDEFFVVVRPAPNGAGLLLSDATAALDYDVAEDVLDRLHVDVPDLDPDEVDDVDPWEEGDLAVLADLGLPDGVMSIIVGDNDLYADEQLGMIAARLGFGDELAQVLDTLGI